MGSKKIHSFFYFIVVVLLATSAKLVFSESSDVALKNTIKLANNNLLSNGLEFHLLYKSCENIEELEILNNKLSANLKENRIKILNDLYYARFLVKYGRLNEASKILSDREQEISENDNLIKGEYYAVLGILSLRSENPTLSIANYHRALRFHEKLNDAYLRQLRYMNLGVTHNALMNLDSASLYFDKAKALSCRETEPNETYLELNIAVNKIQREQFEEAKRTFIKALPLIRKDNDTYAEVKTLANIADILKDQDSIANCLLYYDSALVLAKANDLLQDQIRVNMELSRIYFANEEYQEAYNSLKQSDSIRGTNNILMISQHVAEGVKQQEINFHKKEKELKEQIIQDKQRLNTIIIGLLVVLAIVVLVILRQFFTLKQKNQILLDKTLKLTKSVINPNTSVAHKKEEKIETEGYKNLIRELEKLSSSPEFFKNSSITLDGLAKQLNTNRSYLSEAINTHYKTSFSKWLNEHRINLACDLLLKYEYDKYSLEGIANMVGFSSISAFNSNFKKITGITPSYFRENKNLINSN